MRTTLTGYLASLAKAMRWKLLLALELMICVSLTEGIGLLILFPVIELVGLDVKQGTVEQTSRLLTSLLGAIGLRYTLLSLLAVYITIIAVRVVLDRWHTTVSQSLQYDFGAHLRENLYEALINTNWLFFTRSRSSDFTHALTTETDRVGTATYFAQNLVATVAVTGVYLLFALKLSASMTGLALTSGFALILLLRKRTREARRRGEEVSDVTSDLYAAISGQLGGMKTAKSYGVEDRHVSLFRNLSDGVRHIYISSVRNNAYVRSSFELGSMLVLSLILYVSLEILAVPTADLLVLLFLFGRIMPRVSAIQQSYHGFLNFLPAFATIMELQVRCEAAAEPRTGATDRFALRDGIRFDRVYFQYDPKCLDPVIYDLSLSITAGETTAIVGPSGAGKTTIADLVMGLITPDRGSVLVDDGALTPKVMRAWREQIGYVAQDPFLFNDTVRANLLWARPDATMEEIQEALRLAAADEFVFALPKGLDTIIGERGVLISGGGKGNGWL